MVITLSSVIQLIIIGIIISWILRNVNGKWWFGG